MALGGVSLYFMGDSSFGVGGRSEPQQPIPFSPLPSPVIRMPSLSMDSLSSLPAILDTDMSLQVQIGSQGFFGSVDGTYAYSHESTVASSYFQRSLKLPCSVNMDRGGVVTRPDGTLAACIADGVGGDGFFSAFVAQRICEYIVNFLSHKSVEFVDNDGEHNKKIVEKLFGECFADFDELQSCNLKGSSTALFAECVPTNLKRDGKKIYKLCIGALGDGAIIHIDSKRRKALQLNEIYRDLGPSGRPDVTSTGGGIDVLRGIWDPQNIVAKVVEVSEDDYIVLVTDGFLDNVRDNRIAEMVELVAYHPFFDQSCQRLKAFDCFWEKNNRPILPTVEDIKSFIANNKTPEMTPDVRPTVGQITKRLATYTEFVTYTYWTLEEKSYRGQPAYFGKVDENTPKTDDTMIITISPARK